MTNSRKVQLLKLDWDNYDAYGSTMKWAFGCADALYAADELVPDSWKFCPGPLSREGLTEDQWEAQSITEDVNGGALTWDDVRELGNALLRYRDILAATERDY